jgi:hypothetical protein
MLHIDADIGYAVKDIGFYVIQNVIASMGP